MSGQRVKILSLEESLSDPLVWGDYKKIAEVQKEIANIKRVLEPYDKLCSRFDEICTFAQIAEEEDDYEMSMLATSDLNSLRKDAEALSIISMFQNEHDNNNCFLEINAGAGGTESHDWASIMMRMYLRFAEAIGLKPEIVNIMDGEEAGIKSCCIKISGSMAYGWLRTESGVHRLVRISPFNAAGKRMTSFASCWVYPEVDDNIDIVVEDKDIRIDTYRSSGAGGQHVNTTDSAVRITHLKTGIVVQCQNDRSQHKNKATAMNMLKSRLYDLALKEKNETAQEQNAAKTDIGWGNQIRSYVLQPYQMVKDLRTLHETSDTKGVLDGDLKQFVKAALSAR